MWLTAVLGHGVCGLLQCCDMGCVAYWCAVTHRVCGSLCCDTRYVWLETYGGGGGGGGGVHCCAVTQGMWLTAMLRHKGHMVLC